MTDPCDSTGFASELRAILKEGAEEVMGLDETQALLERLVVPPPAETVVERGELAHMHNILEEEYGHPAARGLALRVGRAGFRRGLKRWGQTAGLLDTSFRLLPSKKRIYTGLAGMAAAFGRMFDLTVEVGQTESQWTWQIAQGALGVDYRTSRSFSSLITGTLQEFLSWAGSGRVYQVREVECPGACLFVIEKKPLD